MSGSYLGGGGGGSATGAPSAIVISADTTLSGLHNNMILVCNADVTLTAPVTLAPGFICWIRPLTTQSVSVEVTAPDTLEGVSGASYDITPFNNAEARLFQYIEGAFLINGNVAPS